MAQDLLPLAQCDPWSSYLHTFFSSSSFFVLSPSWIFFDSRKKIANSEWTLFPPSFLWITNKKIAKKNSSKVCKISSSIHFLQPKKKIFFSLCLSQKKKG